MIKPNGKIHFYRDWATYEWYVGCGKFICRPLPMQGKSVWESDDGYSVCWRFLGAM